jgi:hypothetical protein
MHSLRRGDYWPLIFASVMLMAGLVFLFDFRGLAGLVARRTYGRFSVYRRLHSERAHYWATRAIGFGGVAAAVFFLVAG